MKKHCQEFFEFAAGTRALLISFTGVVLMLLLVFPALFLLRRVKRARQPATS